VKGRYLIVRGKAGGTSMDDSFLIFESVDTMKMTFSVKRKRSVGISKPHSHNVNAVDFL
jgi:hypothetical protein